jgi:DNA polymerase
MSGTEMHPAARQWIETGRLLGVPFAPVAIGAPAPDAVPPTTPESPAGSGRAEVPAPTPPAPGSAPGSAPAPAPAPASAPAAPSPPGTSLLEGLPADPAAALAALADRYEREVVPRVTEYRFTRVVFGEGDPRARLMVIGEGPGAEEDRSGRPFVGPAGQKLEQMLGAMKLAREDVYIANVVKIRPPGNRTPLVPEIERCGPYLAAQIRVIRPAVILALGGPATKWLLGTEDGITRRRGVWASWVDDSVAGGPPFEVPVLPTYHPAYLLRNYTRETREQMWHDLQAVMARLAEVDAP